MKDPYGLAASGVPPEVLLKMQGSGKEALYQALLAQGLGPIPEPQTKGRFATPLNPLSGVAKVLQAYIGQKGLDKSRDNKLKAYTDWKSSNEAKQLAIAEAIANLKGPQGRPAVPAQAAVPGKDAVAMALNPQSSQGFTGQGQLGLQGELPPVQPTQTSPTGGPIGLNGPDGPFPIISNDPVARDIEAAANFQPSNEEMEFYNSQIATQPTPIEQQGLSIPDIGVTPSQDAVPAQPAIAAQEATPPPLPTVGSVMQEAIAIAKQRNAPLQQVIQSPQMLAKFEQAKETQKIRELSEGERVVSPDFGVIAENEKAPKPPAGWQLGTIFMGKDAEGKPLEQKIFYRTNAAGEPETMPVGKQGTKGPLATASASVTPEARGDTEYFKTRLAAQATALDELDKSADSAYKNIRALDRFVASSKGGTAGGAQPIISATQNFLASFGFESDALKNVRQMEQAVGQILSNYMQELGARGLTDQDMKVLAQSLPRVATDKQARQSVADILKKSYEFTIKQWEHARAEEARIHPEMADRQTTPFWYKEYKSAQPPPGVAPAIWDVMTPEEKATFQ